jgi:predicted transcriptional regulator
MSEVTKIGEKSFDSIGAFPKGGQLERLERLREEITGNLDDISSPRDKGKIDLILNLIDDDMLEEYNRDVRRARKVVLSRWNGNGFNKRRSEVEVLASILEVASRGVNKTKILYKANLSYSQLVNYLRFLTEKGLMEVKSKGAKNTYTTTVTGLLFLTAWKKTIFFLE